jgi:2-hydroxy-6-oxonona-2,4-dienedioate hydrolase
MMGRRQFFSMLTFAAAGAALTGCSFYYGRKVTDIEISMAGDVGTLRHTSTSVNGLRMHSLVSIDPVSADVPAVVLVHGSGLSGRYMIPTARELTTDFRVYVPELPGFGDSGKPQEVLKITELADWLADWMAAIGPSRGSLLGNSFGCQVIADLAARYPDRVEHAVLQGPTTPPDERSWFWQFIRWRQNQRYNPSSLGDVTNDDHKKCGFRRMYWSFQQQLTDRIEDKAPGIPHAGGPRRARSDFKSAVVRGYRPSVPAGVS